MPFARVSGPLAVAFAVLSFAGCSCEETPTPECRFDVDCGSGLVCSDTKMCVAAARCPETPCAAAQSCLIGVCYNDDCPSAPCGDGQVCAQGSCTDTVCIGVQCPGGTCAKGTCYPQSCPGESCQTGEVCSGGSCTTKSCAGVTCPGGQKCAGEGQCYPGACSTGPCNAGQLCVAGTCTEERCVGVTCGAGSACAQGQCLPTECGGAPCPGGQVCGSTGCVEAPCALVVCPGGYRCGGGVCVPGLADGGYPRLPDGGTGVVLGPDGGVIGVVGRDGGLLTGPDGGPVGGPCRPGACDEIDCGDGIDNNFDGIADCQAPTCEGLSCDDHNNCSSGDVCSGGLCEPVRLVSCTPPTHQCAAPPVCDESLTCQYATKVGASCDAGVCHADGGCGAPIVGPQPFGYQPANFLPGSTTPSGPVTLGVWDGGSGAPFTVGFDTGTNSFSGNWGGNTPRVHTVTMLGGGGTAAVLAMQDFTLGSNVTLRLTGPRPVILAAFGDVDLQGVIDASARGAQPGAGGNHAACGAGSGGPGTSTNGTAGGGGGAGGRTAGGVGGQGSNGGPGGAAGAQRGNLTVTPLQGGCPGGPGGSDGGVGGAGGGALQLSAAGMVLITGSLNVSGGGGLGGQSPGTTTSLGGAGGGSGGALLLEGALLGVAAGKLIANGGSGGEGSGAALSGEDGHDGWYTKAGTDGGYLNAPLGGNGGMGGGRTVAAQGGQNGFRVDPGTGWEESAGGGGGGAPGYIRVNVPAAVCVIPPEFIVSPALTNANGGTCSNGA